MPFAAVRGVRIRYEVLGEGGPWVALSPGGRNALEHVEPLARSLAGAGYRVLLHDRRNCGASDVVIEGEQSEYEIWADDLHALLTQLGALPAFIGGGSSGARLSLLFALRYPASVAGLLLWRVTGGRRAAERLSEKYYGQYIRLAREGGMAAVCQSEEFSERIAARPESRERLLSMDRNRFVSVMAHWRSFFEHAGDMPVLGVQEDELRSIGTPACVIPGNDNSHPRQVGENLARLLPRGELHPLPLQDVDEDLCPHEVWDALEPGIAQIFIGFLGRAAGKTRRLA